MAGGADTRPGDPIADGPIPVGQDVAGHDIDAVGRRQGVDNWVARLDCQTTRATWGCW